MKISMGVKELNINIQFMKQLLENLSECLSDFEL